MPVTKTYTYFPGCCMHGFARHCQDSLRAVFEALDLELRELPDHARRLLTDLCRILR